MGDGFVHTVFENGAWINKIEGQGPFPSTWATKEDAVAVGRAAAMGRETEHVIHNEDGTISERNLYVNVPALSIDSLDGMTPDPTEGMTPDPTEVDPKEVVVELVKQLDEVTQEIDVSVERLDELTEARDAITNALESIDDQLSAADEPPDS